MKPVIFIFTCIACAVSSSRAEEWKVDLNPPERRTDILSEHGENWPWQEGSTGSKKFGEVTVTFKTTSPSTIIPVWFKGSLDFGARMVSDGIALKPGSGGEKEIQMVVSGLAVGKHRLTTYHNEVRDVTPGQFSVLIGDQTKLKNLLPTKRATNDYDATSASIEVDARAGKDVVVRFVSAQTNGLLVINGFEIDASDPATKAIKPSPKHDDEHVDADAGSTKLGWTKPPTAVSHDLYLGTDPEAVRKADRQSNLFKGNQTSAEYFASKLQRFNDYWWRVDEIDSAGEVTRGELWHFRTRQLAFPTAEGYGRFASGGRGGRVIEVTNLDDYDPTKGEVVIPGSFRAAIEAEGPRTIIFRVSGLIRLKRPCAVRNPYCTVAGQTAPGDGICLADFSSGAYGTHDVIIRFIRFRIGDAARKAMDGAGLGSSDHCIMDHCSISWSSDEGTSSRGAKNITFQRNIIAEALHHGPHYRASDRTKFETHAFAGSISGKVGSFHHNLLAHCTDRNWSLAGGYDQSGRYDGYLDIRNNVVYNWTGRTTDGGVMQLNYVNNYYKPNPKNPFVKWLLKLDDVGLSHGNPKYFMAGNVMEGFDYENDNWKAFQNGVQLEKIVRADVPLFESYVTTHTAAEAFTNVLANVGASFPNQDVIDRRIIDEVRNGTTHYTGTKGPTYGDRPSPNFAGIIDEPTDNKDALGSPTFPWPNYRTYDVPVDSDHDGMPDQWEIQHGLNPKNPRDGNQDRDHDGYTNLEEYLGSLIGEFKTSGKVK